MKCEGVVERWEGNERRGGGGGGRGGVGKEEANVQ